MKLLKIVSIAFIIPLVPSFAQTAKVDWSHPMVVEPVSLYSKVRANFTYWDKSNPTSFEKNRNLGLEGEYRLGNQWSALGSIGRNEYRFTNAAPQIGWDRLGAGIKYAKEFSAWGGDWIWGASLRVFDRQRTTDSPERENPNFFQVRPSLGLGYKSGDFQVQAELRFQTETNSSGKESNLEQFRRYYQLGLAPSLGLTESFRVFTELEYREPYNPAVDTRTRYFHLAPGFTYGTKWGTFGLSYAIPVIAAADNAFNQTVRISYFAFF